MADAVVLHLAMFSEFPACCCPWLIGSLGLTTLRSSQKAVDPDAGDRNDEKRDDTTASTDCIPRCIVPEGIRAKSPDEGEPCTNSPGRYNLFILDVEEQHIYRSRLIAAKLKSEAVVNADPVTVIDL